MTEFQTTLLASIVGAAVGSLFSIIALFVNSYITKTRERQQLVWTSENNRMLALEQRAGRVVEIACSHRGIEQIRELIADDLEKLNADAGHYLRHRDVALAIRNLHNGVTRLIDDKSKHKDTRELVTEVDGLFNKLLKESDIAIGRPEL